MGRAAIIVAGGAATRLGGVSKPWLHVAGRPMIEYVIEAAEVHADVCVVVGTLPADARLSARVMHAVEQPVGSGPAMALRAGMQQLDHAVDEVLVLAGDAPGIATALHELCAHPMRRDAVAALHDGRPQYLLARIRRAALEAALNQAGASMRSVFDHLQIDTIAAHVRDADTWEDVALIRAESGAMALADAAWMDEVAKALGIEPVIDVDAVLSLTRDVAHNLERKNAPLTSYLLGYAAATQGLSAAQVAQLAEDLARRARERGAHD